MTRTPAPDFGALGVVVGHATDDDGVTGLTVVRGATAPFRGSVAILGRATGTRELDALSPRHLWTGSMRLLTEGRHSD